MVPFSLLLLKAQGDFSLIFTIGTCQAPGGKTHKVWGLPMTCPHCTSSSSSITVQVVLPRDLFPQQFLLRSLCPGVLSHDSLYSSVCLSNLGGSSLPSVFSFLMDARRVVNLSMCSAFYLLLGQSGQAIHFIMAIYTLALNRTHPCKINILFGSILAAQW